MLTAMTMTRTMTATRILMTNKRFYAEIEYLGACASSTPIKFEDYAINL